MGTLRTTLTGVLTLAFAVILAGPAQADPVDLHLVRDAAAIQKAVRDLGAETVTVLKFEVKTGNAPATFDAGLANVVLMQKLENLLVMSNPLQDPLFIVNGVSAQLKDLPPDTTWRTAEGRKALAGIKNLQLAWDARQKTMTPDAFITGLLELNPEKAAAKLTLYGFTRKNPADLKVIYTSKDATENRTAVAADRALFSLAGQSYVVEDSKAPNGVERSVGQQIATRMDGNFPFADIIKQSPVQLDILLNGQILSPKADMSLPGSGRIDSIPQQGDQIQFRLTNKGDKMYAVVLAVNGRNTNSLGKDPYLHAREARFQRKWLLSPGEQIVVQGFYVDSSGQYKPFEVLGDKASAETYASLNAIFRGLITLHVFGEKPAVMPPQTPSTPLKSTAEETSAKNDREEASIVTLGLGGSAIEEVRLSGNLDSAQKQLQSLANVSQKDGRYGVNRERGLAMQRGLIGESPSMKMGSQIEKLDFTPDSSPLAFIQIRYYGK